MRACVISADRWVSALEPSDLHSHIKNNTLDTLVAEHLLSLKILETERQRSEDF